MEVCNQNPIIPVEIKITKLKMQSITFFIYLHYDSMSFGHNTLKTFEHSSKSFKILAR